MVSNMKKKSPLEDLLNKIEAMGEKLKKDGHTGKVIFNVEIDYNQGGIRNSKVKLLVDI